MNPHLLLALAEGMHEQPVEAILDPAQDLERLLTGPPELPPAARRRLLDPGLPARAAALAAACADHGVQILTPPDDAYPPLLRTAPLRPLALFVRGDPTALGRAPAVTVVGSRTPTPYGADAAAAFAAALAGAGVVLWSGLARGVDALAHRRSITAGTPTVAVLAGGLEHLYPPEHDRLAAEILAGGGCVLSELPPDRRARRGHFPRRNRILAGATGATLVIEAGATSGSLLTARFAGECGRGVFCVPGPWSSSRSRGCHELIQEGCALAADPADLLRDLGLQPSTPQTHALQLHLSADQRAVLDGLQRGPRPLDLVHRESGLPRAQFLAARLQLERDGRIRTLPGGMLALIR